ncbi:hypothetical protein [Streptomyces sp. cg36]|uniref:InlB B-repeat-containing protein n=1 Tax=Streptomyces sp. cg36 TaxID=3238798 RepID=UPI0034E21612
MVLLIGLLLGNSGLAAPASASLRNSALAPEPKCRQTGSETVNGWTTGAAACAYAQAAGKPLGKSLGRVLGNTAFGKAWGKAAGVAGAGAQAFIKKPPFFEAGARAQANAEGQAHGETAGKAFAPQLLGTFGEQFAAAFGKAFGDAAGAANANASAYIKLRNLHVQAGASAEAVGSAFGDTFGTAAVRPAEKELAKALGQALGYASGEAKANAFVDVDGKTLLLGIPFKIRAEAEAKASGTAMGASTGSATFTVLCALYGSDYCEAFGKAFGKAVGNAKASTKVTIKIPFLREITLPKDSEVVGPPFNQAVADGLKDTLLARADRHMRQAFAPQKVATEDAAAAVVRAQTAAKKADGSAKAARAGVEGVRDWRIVSKLRAKLAAYRAESSAKEAGESAEEAVTAAANVAKANTQEAREEAVEEAVDAADDAESAAEDAAEEAEKVARIAGNRFRRGDENSSRERARTEFQHAYEKVAGWDYVVTADPSMQGGTVEVRESPFQGRDADGGTSVTFIPHAPADYQLSYWILNGKNTAPTNTETGELTKYVDTDTYLTAVFVRSDTCEVTVTSSPVEGGTAYVVPKSDDGRYKIGTVIRGEAVPAPGYRLDHWEVNGRTDPTFGLGRKIIQDQKVIAVFRKLT